MSASVEVQLKILTAKREMYFEKINRLYNFSRNIDLEENRNLFTAEILTLDSVLAELNQTVQEINVLQASQDEGFQPDFSILNKADQMLGHIKQCQMEGLENIGKSNKRNTEQVACKLPKLNLMEFSGDTKEWPLFFETFKALIHENTSLNDITKCHYLMGTLKGKALEMCSGIVPSATNYNVIWELLVNKFQDKRMLANTYLKKILDFKPPKENTVASLNLFIERFDTNVKSLLQLGIPDLGDYILTFIATSKLDSQIQREFETIWNKSEMPAYKELLDFIKTQARVLTQISIQENKFKNFAKLNCAKENSHAFVLTNKDSSKDGNILKLSKANCNLCKSHSHGIINCPEFSKFEPPQRYNIVKEYNLCLLCLGSNHGVKNCKSKRSCKICERAHNTLLHFGTSAVKMNLTTKNSANCDQPMNDQKDIQNFCSVGQDCDTMRSKSTVLLATAVVFVEVPGIRKRARILLDSASQSHFISEELCRELRLEKTPTNAVVSGIGQLSQIGMGEVEFKIKSRFDENCSFKVRALVIPKITEKLPSIQIIGKKLNYLNCLKLADDTLERQSPVDGILGADLFPLIMGTNKIKGPENLPIAVESCFGYVVMGRAPAEKELEEIRTFCSFTDNLEQTMEKFWKLEEIPGDGKPSGEDVECLDIFKNTFSRDASGQYTVSLPFKRNPQELGNSYNAALRRFLNLEKRLRYCPELKTSYDECLRDYINQGHMVEIDTTPESPGYYIPHHAVVKEDSITTKVRVVFDASCRTESGKSLNDILYVGPKLYENLCKILWNFRLFPFAITADIKQMYRMIKMQKDHQAFQKILWRWNPNETLKTFQLTTVVFGIKSSPFLALRTIKQLLHDEKTAFPRAVNIADNSLYMDDLAASILDESEACSLSSELIALFKVGGFNLTKWASNSDNIIQTIPAEKRLSTMVGWDQDLTLKILGLQWDPIEDEFFFKLNYLTRPATKRNILSATARIFDPLGFLTPITLFLKILVKKLWLSKLDWDDVPPKTVCNLWHQFEKEVGDLSSFRISRHLGIFRNSELSLVGFSDASEVGYGAVIYCRVILPNGNIMSKLVCGKSRVAPVKSLSIPRLELCGAYLLSKLAKSIVESFSEKYLVSNLYCFTDSTVVLSWIKAPSNRWKTFVANRVAKIQENVGIKNWYHVNGHDNPSDLASRGCLPSELKNNELWWSGPEWLKKDKSEWPIDTVVEDSILEKRVVVALASQNIKIKFWEEIFKRISTWEKLLKIIFFVLKFCGRLHREAKFEVESLQIVENIVFRLVQWEYFSEDIRALNNGLECSLKIRKLSPILVDGLIRVGGRLNQSNLSFDQRHPILLSPFSPVTQMIVDYYHIKNLHTGSYLLVSLLRQKFWILGIRNLVRKRIRECNLCFRAKPKSRFPPMADLPSCRLLETKAFLHTSVDMAGPVHITLSKHRGVRSQKAYIVLFVCLVTKAVHLELVSALSTQCFIDALRRFLARRGPCSFMYSDRGTNFIGAKNKIEEAYLFLESNDFKEAWERVLVESRIKWKFNPPAAPHFGGIWEANIKCVKSYLVKLVRDRILSYEEFQTVLIQIEGILNSRPLYALSDDPNDPQALTPGHFLNITAPPAYLPLKDDIIQSDKAVTRYQLLSQLVNQFWKRWKLEYLHTLQPKGKWYLPTSPLKVGTVVILNVEDTAPMNWPLGIVTQIFPGKDGIVRVAEVKTKKGVYTRPVVKLFPLPNQ